MPTLLYLNVSLVVVLIGFNAWNWWMACSGLTTIEAWQKFHLQVGELMYDYSYATVRDNLFIIFGTTKLLRILSPSMRSLPLSGVEFSYLVKEAGYEEDGFKWSEIDCGGHDNEKAPEVEMTGFDVSRV